MLRTLCIILDHDSDELYNNYKFFKCNGHNDWFESFSLFPWMVPAYDPTFDDLEALNKKISLYLSTNKDPFVWANYNGTFHFSSIAQSYDIAGIWLITCAIALLIIPFLVYIKRNPINSSLNSQEKEDETYQLKMSHPHINS